MCSIKPPKNNTFEKVVIVKLFFASILLHRIPTAVDQEKIEKYGSILPVAGPGIQFLGSRLRKKLTGQCVLNCKNMLSLIDPDLTLEVYCFFPNNRILLSINTAYLIPSISHQMVIFFFYFNQSIIGNITGCLTSALLPFNV
ncbi:hypothetical protein H5410_053387 [Solanum commersonii]|uniref:Uncharacterized protein n=1 Tax=Solanum commersonii TaxID=4109 RepID=A0A9J5X6Z0_SOLCO|nr:hypothetical protein H5410_053387 [Solanum commersonii]